MSQLLDSLLIMALALNFVALGAWNLYKAMVGG